MSPAPEAFFLPVESPTLGQRFCIHHRAQGSTLRGRVVYIHPFAEEMNKSRRMAALQSRALAAVGFSVLQIDLHGCGDSSGDFGDASWQDWIDDVLRACAWLRERDAAHAQAPLWLWGLRAGCLLAAEAASRLDEPCNFCFWQATGAGNLALQQFMRLRVVGDMLTSNSKGLMNQLREQLAQGQSVEIAGYLLAPALADGLQKSQLLPPRKDKPGRAVWFELSMNPDHGPSPVVAQIVRKWADSDYAASAHAVLGPAFWQTAEIEIAPALIELTQAILAKNPEYPAA